MALEDDQPAWASQLLTPDSQTQTPEKTDEPAWASQVGGNDVPAPGPRRPSLGGNRPRPVVQAPAQPPTQFQKAAQPQPKSAPELSWGQVGQQAWQNAPSSALGAGKAMLHGVTHLPETLSALGQLGGGLFSQAQGALGMQQDPKTKAKTEALARALESHYVQTYGSVKGFKKAVATDPVSVAMDASTFLGGAGLAADAAGFTKTASTLGKLSSAVDPVSNAVRLAKIPLKAAGATARQASSLATGVPVAAQKLATLAAAHPDPAVRAAYSKFVTGQGDATEFQQTAQNALSKIRDDASAQYLAGKGQLKPVTPSFQPIDAAIANARNTTQRAGVNIGQFPQANAAIDDVENLIRSWKATPNPAYHDLDGIDNLKRAIWDKAQDFGSGTEANSQLMGIYHGARKSLVDADPAYADLMEQYQIGKKNLNDLTKTLSLGKNAAATTSLVKGLSALKTAPKQNVLQQLIIQDPRIGAMLAGAAFNPWHAGGRSAFEAGAASIAAASAYQHPAAMMAAVPVSLAASSPRLAGAVNYGVGKLDRVGSKILPAAKPAYYAGRTDEEAIPTAGGDTQSDQPEEPPEGAQRAPIQATPEDIDAATRMVMGEAGAESDIGKAAALHTAINRALQSGKSLSDAIYQPNAFEAVTSGRTKNIDPDSPQYKYIRDHIVIPSLSGELPDNTGGALNFINMDLQRQLGRKIPAWAQREGTKIGRHTFFAPEPHADGGRIERASGGRVDSTKQEQLVQRLMKLAKQAKKAADKTTEPLLKERDETIVKALDIAQQAI